MPSPNIQMLQQYPVMIRNDPIPVANQLQSTQQIYV